MSREFLVTKFVCSKCGGNLSLTYERPSKQVNHSDGEPTGASMVQQIVVVEPCGPCFEPLNQVRRTLAVLNLQAGDKATGAA